jgi:hypothetical protein
MIFFLNTQYQDRAGMKVFFLKTVTGHMIATYLPTYLPTC